MKKHLLLPLLSFIFLFTTTLTHATTTITFSDCDAVQASLTGVTPCNNCYAQGGPAWSGSKMFVKFRLSRKSGGSWTFIQEKSSGSSTVIEFTGLSDGEYRVEGFFSTQLDGICYPAYNYIGQQVGCIGGWVSDGFSNELEVGYPEVDGVLFDLSGTVGNNVFCSSDISSQGGIFLNTSGTYGESDWSISICKKSSSGSCSAWTSTYWQETPMPTTINLLTEVWQLHHSGWDFWTGEYDVQIAINKDNCTGWESETITFYVVTSGCRENEPTNLDINLYPNPTTAQIQLEGLEMVEGDIKYQIMDMSGRPVASDYLLSPTYPIQVEELTNGIYILQLEVEGELINKRFSVLKK